MRHIIFKDSFNFLSTSLEKLCSNLKTKAKGEIRNLPQVFPHLYRYFKSRFPHLPLSAFNLLSNKSHYPFEHMSSFENFSETSLPSRQSFYSTVSMKTITEEEYEFAQKVWRTFGCRTMRDYHNLYVSCDTFILADVFENFRSMSERIYDLDPVNFSTAPGLSWMAALKHSKVELDILTDIEMALFIDRSLLGGYSAVVNPVGQANNEYLGPAHYNPDLPKKYILLLDCNNEYGYSMSGYLPYGNFRWIQPEEFSIFTERYFKFASTTNKTSYFVECDLEYPVEFHDDEAHSDFPLAMEKMDIVNTNLSDYQKKLTEALNLRSGGEKLCATFYKKHKYILHLENLQQYLKLGLKLGKIHRILAFDQKIWLRSYVELNTELRRQASDASEKDFCKLMVGLMYLQYQ